ncbi:RxLR effector protein [Phytophthora megakarya]|uniref:RxLR effector protein n=1 Tax=Phytophthora megakarya TaxID=4795 RepID=A0A225WDK5_9STRA|nr:RxLR effector protein [Phytophthora megakarya]
MDATIAHTRPVLVATLLAVVVLQSCINAISTDFLPTNSPNLHHASSVQGKRNLRIQPLATADAVDDRLDERGLNLGVKLKDLTTSATKTLEKFALSAKINKITNNQLATDKSFTKLNVDKVKSNLLESQEFLKWVRSVNKAYKQNVEEGEAAIVTTLTTHYGDKALANLLNEAKGVASTVGVGSEGTPKKWIHS